MKINQQTTSKSALITTTSPEYCEHSRDHFPCESQASVIMEIGNFATSDIYLAVLVLCLRFTFTKITIPEYTALCFLLTLNDVYADDQCVDISETCQQDGCTYVGVFIWGLFSFIFKFSIVFVHLPLGIMIIYV